jgi:thioredoxin-dependent peroxiredoxin
VDDMTAELEEGAVAPDFDLPTALGQTVRLDALKGQKVVLYFYPKDDTAGCTAEAIAFNGLKSQFAKAGAEIIGVSPDSPASHARFSRKHKLGLTLASDEALDMLRAYGVWMEKSMYGRKYMGVERATFLIDAKGAIARVWRKVKTPGHAEEVLEAAQAL